MKRLAMVGIAAVLVTGMAVTAQADERKVMCSVRTH